MLEIANSPEGILQKDISIRQSISEKYLDQIVAGLKAAGLIVRGAKRGSGYQLLKKKEDITVYDIYKAFEFELNISGCVPKEADCPLMNNCKTRSYWCELNKVVKDHMKAKTLADIIENHESEKDLL